MNAAAIVALIQLTSTLAPEVVKLINNIITAIESNSATPEEKVAALDTILNSLKPMEKV